MADRIRPAEKAKGRRGRPSHREDRANEVLDAAARVLNAQGLTNTSLEAVAASLGVTKSALYYYFRNKQELVFKCYLRSCEVACAAVEKSLGEEGTGRDRLESYIRRQISPDNPPVAFVGEIEFLEPQQRDSLRIWVRRHHEALVQLLEESTRDGSLVMPAPNLVVYSLKGALNWMTVWFDPGGPLDRQDIAEAFIDLFMFGLAPRDQRPLRQAIQPVRLDPAPEPLAFDRAEHASRRRDVLVRAGSEFFNRNGFDNCTLEDIAGGLAISRSALYHYVSSKEYLLYAGFVRSLDVTEIILKNVDSLNEEGCSKIERTIRSAVELQAGQAGPIANYARLKSLTQEHAAEVRERSNALEARLAGFFNRGLTDGSIRPLDSRMARLALLGAVNWLPRWFTPAVSFDPDSVAANLVHLFIHGLVPRRG